MPAEFNWGMAFLVTFGFIALLAIMVLPNFVDQAWAWLLALAVLGLLALGALGMMFYAAGQM